jgi:methylmalonyl-CoA mutase cobalamin-binding domain/chain
MNPLMELSQLVQQGENRRAVACAHKLLEESYSVTDIVQALADGLAVLRNKCTVENFQLLDVLLASRAMVEVVDECIANKLERVMDEMVGQYAQDSGKPARKTVVIGSIEGDVHDLGKHVVATLLRFNDFNVVNLGKDVPVDNFVEAAIRENADFVGVSCMMTVCMPRIREIKSALAAKGRGGIKVVGGGAALQQTSAESLDLDYRAYDAFDGLDYFMNTSGLSATAK